MQNQQYANLSSAIHKEEKDGTRTYCSQIFQTPNTSPAVGCVVQWIERRSWSVNFPVLR